MADESHTIMDGKVHIYRRERSRNWQCATYLGGRNHRKTTRQSNLAVAIEFARDWYMDRYADERLRLRGALPSPSGAIPTQLQTAGEAPAKRLGRPKTTQVKIENPFREVAAVFLREVELITQGERSETYVLQKAQLLERHLLPFFGDTAIKDVTSGRIQDYRLMRLEPPPEDPKPRRPVHIRRGGKLVRKAVRPWVRPARSTMHNEMVCLRQVLKTARRHGWLDALPDMSTPYKASGKISHRAWFSPEEYKRFYEATRERARNPKKERWRAESEQLHDWVLFMVNTGLRPDEAKRLEDRDLSIVIDEDTSERILEIEVRGKRGVGYCKSMPGAVLPYLRQKKRRNLQPLDRVWGEIQRELFNAILRETDLKTDREGKRRTAYSLRHTYISMRLIQGADIYQIAKNCRTSVKMIETFYAAHIKNVLDAAAINRRKPQKPKTERSKARAPADA
jgi:hypothetical protein